MAVRLACVTLLENEHQCGDGCGNHGGAGKIQYMFTPEKTYEEDFLIACKRT